MRKFSIFTRPRYANMSRSPPPPPPCVAWCQAPTAVPICSSIPSKSFSTSLNHWVYFQPPALPTTEAIVLTCQALSPLLLSSVASGVVDRVALPLILAGGRRKWENGAEVKPHRAQNAVYTRTIRINQRVVLPVRVLR